MTKQVFKGEHKHRPIYWAYRVVFIGTVLQYNILVMDRLEKNSMWVIFWTHSYFQFGIVE